jgi:hypothetical protein
MFYAKCVFVMTEKLKMNKKHISTSQAVHSCDLSARIKAAEWGEEDDYIQYLNEIRKK